MNNPIITAFEEKYGGRRQAIIAFLHGNVTNEESDIVHNLYNPCSVAIVGISELMDVVKQMTFEIAELKMRMSDAEKR